MSACAHPDGPKWWRDLLAAVGGASAAGWLAPTSTPPSTMEVDSQDMALDAPGNAVAVSTAHGTWRVTQAATRPLGGSWSTPVTFSVPGEEGGWNPAVAVGANGEAVAVWSSVRRTANGTRQYTTAATREAGGTWSEPVPLSLTGDNDIGVSYQPARRRRRAGQRDGKARVRFEFSQLVPGRRVTARCVKATKANRNKPQCNRYESRGAVTLAGVAGSNTYRFRGTIHHRILEPGRYRLQVAAVQAGSASVPATIRFTIAR